MAKLSPRIPAFPATEKGATAMTLQNRIEVLEKNIAAAAVQKRPIPFGILPAVGDPRRAAVQAEIAERTKAGQRFITYEIIA